MKDFLLICDKNCVAYKQVFPLFKQGMVSFGSPVKQYEGTDKKFGNHGWITTFPVANKKKLVLTATYDPEKYPKYDNYDAIEVSRVKNIPYDYDGVMGVPITFLDHYSPEQFEILGLFGNFNPKDCTPETAFVCGSDVTQYNLPGTQNGGVIITKNGPTALYKRIFIRRKK